MKRPLKVLRISILIVGIGLLIFGIYALNGYFREKKLDSQFGTMTITSEELGAIRNAVLGGIEDTPNIPETENDKAEDIKIAEDGLANLRTEVKIGIRNYLDLEVKTPEDTQNLLSGINDYVKGFQSVLRLQGDRINSLELSFKTYDSSGAMSNEQSSLVDTMKNSQKEVSEAVSDIIADINTIASSLAAEGTAEYQDQIAKIIKYQGYIEKIENVGASD